MSRVDFTVVLSELAALDLADILQYTLEQWGERQMNLYAAKLTRGLRQLAGNPQLGKPREDWYPGCRCFSVEHHLVLYEVVEREVRVARFFHERVDIHVICRNSLTRAPSQPGRRRGQRPGRNQNP